MAGGRLQWQEVYCNQLGIDAQLLVETCSSTSPEVLLTRKRAIRSTL